jgi:eukaryotic-like serine/threonine-protein kinase
MREAPPGDQRPADPAPALVDFLDAIHDSRLLQPEQLRQLEALREPGRGTRHLARALVRRGWMTPWQVRRVYRGRGASLRVGSYLLLERLGQGGMGEVFKARHARLGRLTALKLLRADRLAEGGGVRRFRREVQAAARLDHPNVVHAYDAGQTRGGYFLAMEYVEGTDLAGLVWREGPLPPARACEYARQAALGLQHALERGVVHRDLKPSNLLLSGRGVVKVADFGLARLSQAGGQGEGEVLTAAGQGLGTADYVAPEQVLDARSADTRADLYALGCALYFLLSASPPFPGGSAARKVVCHLKEEPRPLEEVRPGVPPALAAVVRKLMAKSPGDRFQVPAEAADALAGAA